MNNEDIFKIHADFCACLANEKRLRIMWAIDTKEMSVGEIAEELNLPISNISQHLRILRDKGAVKLRKDGHHIYYSVSHENFLKGCLLIREGLIESINSRAKIANKK